ncbi:MAG: hypothetical protein WC623_00860 [Pedobacter sp.]|uniref:hypothetical protein n=1 Tax=Pedobacter sp. TaxID=1411316 RepID=UPI003562B62C
MNTKEVTIERGESLLLNQKEIFNMVDFCRYTGFSKSYAYKLTATRRIKYSCPQGKLIFFRKIDVDEFLMGNPIKPMDDINQEVINVVTGKTSRRGYYGN